MKDFKDKIVDGIKKRYEYKIDIDKFDTSNISYIILYGKFYYSFSQYEFDKNIKERNKILEKKENKLIKII